MALRGLLAVLAGLGVAMMIVVVLTWTAAFLMRVPADAPTTAYVIVNIIISAAAALAGGFLTGRLAPVSRVMHGVGLGVFLFLLALPLILTGPRLGQPSWYPTVIGIVGLVFAPAGSWLSARTDPPASAA